MEISGLKNTSATVLEYNDDGSGSYANIRFDSETNFDLARNSAFTLKVFVPSSGITSTQTNLIVLKLEDNTLGEVWTTQTDITTPVVLLWNGVISLFNST